MWHEPRFRAQLRLCLSDRARDASLPFLNFSCHNRRCKPLRRRVQGLQQRRILYAEPNSVCVGHNMALILHSSSSSSAKTVSTQQLQEALIDFQSVLSDNQRQELRRKTTLPDADAVLIFTAELDASYKKTKGRSIGSNLYTVLQSVRDFSTVVGTFVSAHPEIAALVWGSVQLTTLVRLVLKSWKKMVQTNILIRCLRTFSHTLKQLRSSSWSLDGCAHSLKNTRSFIQPR